MDSLGIPQQIRKERLGSSTGSVTENYTHTFTKDEREAAEKIGELFGTGWPEIDKGKVISFPNLSQKEEELPEVAPEALAYGAPQSSRSGLATVLPLSELLRVYLTQHQTMRNL